MIRKHNKRLSKEAYLKKMHEKGIDENGYLMPDPTPIAPPIGYDEKPSMVELVRDMVRSEALQADIHSKGFETMEEADDFDIGDDAPDPLSGYENELDVPLRDVFREVAEVEAEKEKAAAAPPAEPAPCPPAPQEDPPSEGPDLPPGPA